MKNFILCMLASSLLIGGRAVAEKGAQVQVAFRFVSTFGQRGNGQGQFHDPAGIALDPTGNLYVADTGNDRIQKLGPDGKYLFEAGGFGWDGGQFNRPVGVASRGLEVYVADSRNGRVQIFDHRLHLLSVVGGRDVEGPISLGELGGIAVSEDDAFYVSDIDADQVVQIDTYSRTDRDFGGYGYGAGMLRRPLGLAVDGKGTAYICDSEDDRIAIFDRFGNFKGTLGEESLSEPAGCCLGPEATLFVADTGHHRVLVFDLKSGEVVGWTGGPDPGESPGSFKAPRGMAMGSDNFLYVLDTGNCRVQRFQVLIHRR